MKAQKLFALMKERGVKVRIESESHMVFTGDESYVKYFEDYLSSHKELREEILREISSEQTDIQTEAKELSAMNLSEFRRELELYGIEMSISIGGKLIMTGGTPKIRNRLSKLLAMNAVLKSSVYEKICLKNAERIIKAYYEAWPDSLIVYRERTNESGKKECCFGAHDTKTRTLNSYYLRDEGYKLMNIMSLFKAEVYLPEISDRELLMILNKLTNKGFLYHETLSKDKGNERYELYSCEAIREDQLRYYITSRP